MYTCPKCNAVISNITCRTSFPFPEEEVTITTGRCNCGWEGEIGYNSTNDMSRILHQEARELERKSFKMKKS